MMLKRKVAVVVVGALCVTSMAIGVAADSLVKKIKAELRPDFTIVIDEEVKDFKNAQGETVYPILHEGTTYLPIRAIGEMMGKTVYWYEDDLRIEFKDKKAPTVTDADVIVDGSEKPAKSDEPAKGEKPQDKPDLKDDIGAEKAKEIALKKADIAEKDVIFEPVELDKERGVYIYEVEFKHGLIEYSAEIAAADGTILKWEVEKDNN